MKIAVIGAKGLPAKQGGIERCCQEVYPKMVAQGHSVDLFARPSYTQTPWFSSYKYKGVQVICLPSLSFRGLDALTSSAFAAIASIIKRYDIVHFHAVGPALFSWIPRITSSTGIVVTCHGLDWQRAKWGRLSSSIIHLGEKVAVNYAHELVVVSNNLKSYFWKTYGIDTIDIPNAPGIYAESDPKFPYLKSLSLQQGRYILFLGRLVPEKRPDLLIEAFQSLKPRGWKLVLAGGISEMPEFTSKLVNMAAGNNDILFTGELQGSRLSEIMRGAGIFVLPSDLEGMPLVMLEAMREGIPVVASDIPPHRQLVGQERGLLFETGNPNSCVRCLAQGIQQPLELAKMAKKAQQYVQANYNWEKITADHLALYAKVTDSPVVITQQTNDSIQQPTTELKVSLGKEFQSTLKPKAMTMTPEKRQRLQACLQELTTLLYEETNSREQTDAENLEKTLRKQILEQVNFQLDLLLSSKPQELNKVPLEK
ncbi:MAG: glycosyltransferase family 4 protein [Moorea sp. SIO1F2]|uniref:glycosyltransferase family 4 protein n=1 Tax=Moorena sp. SIO1F2 TaxID=2607819 RepID=UPI0013BD9F23|nr:glycosyltransferase family 4 protein [Moorena sp. SIO1F2]NET83839.1 glycosyltransferase family 4 protein [Moorena sp. SIO1F2]